MTKGAEFGIKYGSQGPARPGLGRWMGLVTLLLGSGLALHFLLYALTVPRATGEGLLPSYTGWWQRFLSGTSLEAEAEVAATPSAEPETTVDPFAATPTGVPTVDPAAESALLSYYPLGEGNRWEYRTHEEGLGTAAEPEGRVLFRVLEVERSGPFPVYQVLVENLQVYYWIEGTELKVARTPGGNSLVALQCPLVRGTVWESPAGVTGYSVEGTEMLDTPLGKLRTLVVRKTTLEPADGERVVQYFADGIGLVRQEIRHSMTERTTWELIGYQVNGRIEGSLAQAAVRAAEPPASTATPTPEPASAE